MGLGWRLLARPVISRLDSEKSHDLALGSLSKLDKSNLGKSILSRLYKSPELPIHTLGRLFHHPLGLAAGMDKGAKALSAWPALGFSWIEYGGITRFPQAGNLNLGCSELTLREHWSMYGIQQSWLSSIRDSH